MKRGENGSRKPGSGLHKPLYGSRKGRLCFAFLFVFVFASGIGVFAQEISPEALFRQAGNLYGKADYAGASSAYQKLADQGYVCPELYYNLGCSYYKQGRTGRAILNFERALRLSPRDRDTRDNLVLTRSRLKDEAPRDEGPVGRLFKILNLNELAVLTSIIYFFFTAALMFYLTRRSEGWLWGAAALGFLLLMSGIWLGARIYDERAVHRAVITAARTEVRNGPGPDYSTAFILHEGTMIQVLKRQGDWLEIGAFGRMKGWLAKNFQEGI
jgi:tetratricopeptide (TPR) repeat protein